MVKVDDLRAWERDLREAIRRGDFKAVRYVYASIEASLNDAYREEAREQSVCRVHDEDDVVPGRICGRPLPCRDHAPR